MMLKTHPSLEFHGSSASVKIKMGLKKKSKLKQQ